jgi:hypothetical protein
MSSVKHNSRKAHGTPDAKDPVAGRPSPQAAGRADEPASSSAEPSATGAVKVKSYEKSEGAIRQVGSARIEYLHDTDYVVTGALSANHYVLVSDHGKGKAELWMGHKNRPSGYCIQYGPLYLEFVRSLSSEEKGDAKPVREPALKFKKLVPGVRVRVVDGSGLDSGREGVIVPNSEAHRLNRQPAGKPSWKENPYGTQYGEPGRYKDFDPSRELIVKDDAGNYFGMFKSHLISVEDYLAQKSMDPTVKPEIPQTSHEWGLANGGVDPKELASLRSRAALHDALMQGRPAVGHTYQETVKEGRLLGREQAGDPWRPVPPQRAAELKRHTVEVKDLAKVAFDTVSEVIVALAKGDSETATKLAERAQQELYRVLVH